MTSLNSHTFQYFIIVQETFKHTQNNTQNDLCKTLKNNIHKLHVSSLFIISIKTLKINDPHKKITHNMITSNPRNWCNQTKIPKVLSSKNVYSFIYLFKFMSVFSKTKLNVRNYVYFLGDCFQGFFSVTVSLEISS